MSSLRVSLLGTPRFERNGLAIEIRPRKNVALIAYLALTGQSHSREALITLLWPELEPSRARSGLRRNLSMLRKTLGGEWLQADRQTVGLNLGAGFWLDVDQFRGLLHAGREHDHTEGEVCKKCLPLLEEAVELYRGDLMAGIGLRDSVEFDEWQFFQTEELRRELNSALERLVRGTAAVEEFERALAHARRWVALDPLNERVQRQLMGLYTRAGQRTAALRQYQECVRVLEAELGLPPSAETTSLYERIRTQAADQEAPLFPVSRPRHNLPAQTTPFVGREDNLREIKTRLNDPGCRLLTLVGPGGSGKTRLALEAAAGILSEAASEAFEHGVFFVSLAPLQSVDAMVAATAQAVGFSFYGTEGGEAAAEPRQQLLDYVRHKSQLLIMDNFEHLLSPSPAEGTERAADLLADILRTTAKVKILVTSRSRLQVQGEHLFPVVGMDFPESMPEPSSEIPWTQRAEIVLQHSAVRLFLTSARRTDPGFELTADNLTDVVQICRLVHGMPLGILLAAAWVEMLTPAEIVAEISQSLDFLETDLRDVPERQRGLRAVFDHSWRLLTERQRELFQKLSVFRGGFTREAAQHVTGVSLRELKALIDKSLIHRTPTSLTAPRKRDVGGRYEVHELLRQYAAEKLDQAPDVSAATHDRHGAHYAAKLREWAADLKGPRQQTALAEMDVEIENIRSAWNWAAERGWVEQLDQAVEGMCLYYEWRGRCLEGETACRLAAERLASTTTRGGLGFLVKVLTWQSVFSRLMGRIERSRQLLWQSQALLEQSPLADHDICVERAFLLREMGEIAFFSASTEEARQAYAQSLALYRALGDRWGAAHVLNRCGWKARWLGDHDKAGQLVEESLVIRRALGDRMGTAQSLNLLGSIASRKGRFEESARLRRESLKISQETGNRHYIALGLAFLGGSLFDQGKFAEAHARYQEGVAIYDELGLHHSDLYSLINTWLGLVKMHLGRYEEASAQGQMCLTLSQEIGYRLGIGFSLSLLGHVALGRGTLTEAQQFLQESIIVFREIGDRNNLMWALVVLGVVDRGLGQLSAARGHLSEALRIAAEIGVLQWHSFALSTLSAVALLLADLGAPERALELYTLASRYMYVGDSHWLADVVGQHIAAVAATLSPDVVAAAQERGGALALEATVAELLVELEP